MRQLVFAMLVVFIGSFAYAIGSRLTDESRALIVGIIIGILASIPAALIAALVAARAGRPSDPPLPPEPLPRQPTVHSQQPPVVIVNPGHATRSTRYAPYIDALLEPAQPRSFTVVGDDESYPDSSKKPT